MSAQRGINAEPGPWFRWGGALIILCCAMAVPAVGQQPIPLRLGYNGNSARNIGGSP